MLTKVRDALASSTVNGVALAVVVCATIVSSVVAVQSSNASQEAVNALRAQDDRQATQDEFLRAQTSCTRRVVFGTVRALNDRTAFTVPNAQQTIRVREAQAKFLRVIVNEDIQQDTREALREYLQVVEDAITQTEKVTEKLKETPYPKLRSYTRCLNDAQENRP